VEVLLMKTAHNVAVCIANYRAYQNKVDFHFEGSDVVTGGRRGGRNGGGLGAGSGQIVRLSFESGAQCQTQNPQLCNHKPTKTVARKRKPQYNGQEPPQTLPGATSHCRPAVRNCNPSPKAETAQSCSHPPCIRVGGRRFFSWRK